ncbi:MULTISPECIES: response regulator [unclassified Paenibacillus]|uniref:response regulator transcription factor n=1 Tax=unclassified Paenibacillus TaxID=185978 RepID=UPI00210D0737|nr:MULTISPECIES: response regulator [unclassified Paenibacillus]
MKVIIVEDVKIVRETLARHIAWHSLGFELAGLSENGEQALELIGRDPEHPPDLLVTDIGMPVMDGLELIRRVREQYPATRCIILSGLGEFHHAQEAIKLGVTDYVLKPVDIEELTAIVTRVAESIREERRSREELREAQRIMRNHLPHLAESQLPGVPGQLKISRTVEKILQLIKAELTSSSLTLQFIADSVYLSEKYVNSVFKQAMGTTIASYIIAQKMELAGRLLQEPEVKVYEVCGRVGYADNDHFRESFKKHHGCTPTEFRNRYLYS